MQAARWSGVAAVAMLWIGIGVALVRTGFPVLGDQPLSRLAADGRAAPIFGPALVIAALLFVAFCSDVRSRYPVGPAFGVVMVAAMTGQLVTGVVPIGEPGESHPLHVVAGLVLGGLIPVFLCLFATGQPPGPWRRTAFVLFGAQAAATVVGVVLSQLGVAAVAEIVPAFFFHVWVAVVSFHDPGPPQLDWADHIDPSIADATRVGRPQPGPPHRAAPRIDQVRSDPRP